MELKEKKFMLKYFFSRNDNQIGEQKKRRVGPFFYHRRKKEENKGAFGIIESVRHRNRMGY